jgi:hypothetical protein
LAQSTADPNTNFAQFLGYAFHSSFKVSMQSAWCAVVNRTLQVFGCKRVDATVRFEQVVCNVQQILKCCPFQRSNESSDRFVHKRWQFQELVPSRSNTARLQKERFFKCPFSRLLRTYARITPAAVCPFNGTIQRSIAHKRPGSFKNWFQVEAAANACKKNNVVPRAL